MKKIIILTFLLLFGCTIAFAQETTQKRRLSFSPYFSYNMTDLRGDYAFSDNIGGLNNKKTSYVETFGGGVDVHYKIKGRLGINSGLFVTQYQSYQIADIATTFAPDVIEFYGRRRKYTFLHLPLQVSYTQPLGKVAQIRLMAGTYAAYFLDRGNIGEGTRYQTDEPLLNSYNSFHIGFLGDARFSFELGKHIDFWFGLRYNKAFNDVKHAQQITYVDYYGKNPESLFIGNIFNFTPSALGFLFGITIK
jgi:hypothetical protein